MFLSCDHCSSCNVCVLLSEDDPATVYSGVRPEDVSYGEIIIKNKQKKKKIKGTAALLLVFSHSLLKLFPGLAAVLPANKEQNLNH